jgi:hypothetical protein
LKIIKRINQNIEKEGIRLEKPELKFKNQTLFTKTIRNERAKVKRGSKKTRTRQKPKKLRHMKKI